MGRFQVLALDGGGTRGLFTANVLARLESDLDFKIQDEFDLVVGTSAGGIIALCLGLGMRPSEIVDEYRRLVESVFPSAHRRARLLRGLVGPMYREKRLREALDETFGDATLADSIVRLAIPAWDAESGRAQVYKTPHASDLRRDGRLRVADVARATSAAPAYFSAAHVDGQWMLDGGIWANNPSLVGLAEAVGVLKVPLADVRLLNIGTMSEVKEFPTRLRSGGWAAWAPRAPGLVLRAGSKGGEGVVQLLMGKDRYVRSDVQVPDGGFGLDSAAYERIAARAAAASRQLSPRYSAIFSGHSVAGRGF